MASNRITEARSDVWNHHSPKTVAMPGEGKQLKELLVMVLENTVYVKKRDIATTTTKVKHNIHNLSDGLWSASFQTFLRVVLFHIQTF